MKRNKNKNETEEKEEEWNRKWRTNRKKKKTYKHIHTSTHIQWRPKSNRQNHQKIFLFANLITHVFFVSLCFVLAIYASYLFLC